MVRSPDRRTGSGEGWKLHRNNVDDRESGGDSDLADLKVEERQVDIPNCQDEELRELRSGFKEVVSDGDGRDLGAREEGDDVSIEPPEHVGVVGGTNGLGVVRRSVVLE
ncbi:hypothetical protein M0R45_037104 [Rubus argutus]|uniref:Uncharacterized protein n=1 Tax=Rubus argutus TaxID=59490 RepID=A0AAW1W2H2_RUBAR